MQLPDDFHWIDEVTHDLNDGQRVELSVGFEVLKRRRLHVELQFCPGERCHCVVRLDASTVKSFFDEPFENQSGGRTDVQQRLPRSVMFQQSTISTTVWNQQSSFAQIIVVTRSAAEKIVVAINMLDVIVQRLRIRKPMPTGRALPNPDPVFLKQRSRVVVAQRTCGSVDINK